MTGKPPEQRVVRLEHDVDAIYELLGEVQATQRDHTTRFDGVDARFDGVDARFDGVDARFDGVDARFDGVDARFDGVDARFDGVDARFDGIGVQLAEMQATLAVILQRLPAS